MVRVSFTEAEGTEGETEIPVPLLVQTFVFFLNNL